MITLLPGILAAMSNLALPARAAAPAFNHDFYVTAATVIPVLFLALAVQGRTYENLVKATRAASRRGPLSWRQELTALPVTLALWTTAGGILIFATVSEVLAIYALYQQQSASSTGRFVLLGVIFMVIVTAAGPALAYLREWLGGIRDMSDTGTIRQKQDASPPETPRPGTSATEPGASEAGKTDTDGLISS